MLAAQVEGCCKKQSPLCYALAMATQTLFHLERELNRRLGPWLDEAEAIRDFCLKSGLAVPSVMLPIFDSKTPTPDPIVPPWAVGVRGKMEISPDAAPPKTRPGLLASYVRRDNLKLP